MSNQPKSILMVFPLAPWPARQNGISIRYYPILEALSRKHKIDVFVHSEPRNAIPQDPIIQNLRRFAVQHSCKDSPGLGDRIATVTEMLSPFGHPYLFSRYHSARVFRGLCAFTAQQRYDCILWVTHEYRDVLRRLSPRFDGARKVYDAIDSPYLHYSREPSPAGLLHFYRAFDLWKTRRWEISLLDGIDAAAYISTPDAATAANGSTTQVYVIPNGIYLEGDQVSGPPLSGPTSLGFLGNMGYSQNVRGCLRLYKDIFLPLKKEFTNLRLMIIGRSPVEQIRKLSSPDVEVTGTVESIWPYVTRVNAFVYPMIGGAGLQNKILEAMHAGKPVVTTEICLKSIGAREGEEILVGRNDEELRAHTRALLSNPQYARDLGMKGKAYVDRSFDMNQVIKRFEQFLFQN